MFRVIDRLGTPLLETTVLFQAQNASFGIPDVGEFLTLTELSQTDRAKDIERLYVVLRRHWKVEYFVGMASATMADVTLMVRPATPEEIELANLMTSG